MQKLWQRLSSLTVVLTLASGCQASHPEPTPQGFEASVYDSQLKETLKGISTSLRVLAETNSEANRRNLTSAERLASYNQARSMPYGMDVTLNLQNWQGPIDRALLLVSEKTGYRMLPPKGRKPLSDINVTINATNRSAYDVMRDISAQAANRAKVRIVVDNKTRRPGIIELFYTE